MADNVRSEDVLGHKWDRCVSDTMIKFDKDSPDDVRVEDVRGLKLDRCVSDTMMKFASGLGLGIVFSVVFFRRRPWPVAFGAGAGLGMGYANCQHDFQNPFLQHGQRIKVPKTGDAKPQ